MLERSSMVTSNQYYKAVELLHHQEHRDFSALISKTAIR